MSFEWETMGEKSGPVVSIRYRENSLYRESPVYTFSNLIKLSSELKCFRFYDKKQVISFLKLERAVTVFNFLFVGVNVPRPSMTFCGLFKTR